MRTDEGQTSVEFALSVTLLLAIVFGIFQLGAFVYRSNALTDAVREGSRCAAVYGADCTTPALMSALVARHSVAMNTPIVVAMSWCAKPPSLCLTPDNKREVGSYVTVRAQTTSTFLGLSLPLSASSTLLVRND